ncbi:MAG TPA: alkaline phosphatase family protein [Candidatus Cybelea sp.]|nr:alkaline phosphatase family protein [Candidatus Cybelea sp.]
MIKKSFIARSFVVLAIVAGLVACGGLGGSPNAGLFPAAGVGMLASSPIKHVIIVIQENRSFDDLFATFPGADGTKTGKAAAMPPRIAHSCSPPIVKPTTVPLKETPLAVSADIDHIYSGYKLELDRNKMDGFDLIGSGTNGSGGPACLFAYQYVNPSDIAPYRDIATQYVLADHTFQTQGSSSFTAHQDLIAGGTQISPTQAIIDNPSYFPWGCDANKTVRTAVIEKASGKVFRDGPFPCLTYETLRDLLDAKSVSWKFYAMPVLKGNGGPGIWSAFDAIKAVRYSSEWHTNVTRTNLDFFTDVSHHRLPDVSWITPDAVNSDHPAERSDTGPSWIASIVNAIGQSHYWDSTAVVVVWDDWGGFYDHVVPQHPHNWQGGPGFRVPMLIVSPYVKPHVDHTVYQFGSVLKFVEDVWNLGSLGNNDQDSTSIGNAFDFKMAPRKFKVIQSKYSRDFFLHQKPSGLPPDTE